MATFIPTTISPPDTAPDDPRVGHLFGASGESPTVVILGFPSDEGVRRNGGRPGAAAAPDAIRSFLYKLTPPPDEEVYEAFTALLAETRDLGNLDVTGDVERDQESLSRALAPYLANEVVPIIIGGGHETSYGHFLGYVEAGLDVHVLNWDAHADVRPLKNGLAHSGSPFRQALDHPSGACASYHVAGLQPHSAALAHVAFVQEHGGDLWWRDEIENPVALYDELPEPLLTSFDMDAVDAAFAPGVSAPCSNGFTPAEWLAAAAGAGRAPGVTSFDLVEVNPAFDRDGQTARLAALTIWNFLFGFLYRDGFL